MKFNTNPVPNNKLIQMTEFHFLLKFSYRLFRNLSFLIGLIKRNTHHIEKQECDFVIGAILLLLNQINGIIKFGQS